MTKDEYQEHLYTMTGEIIEGALLDQYYYDSGAQDEPFEDVKSNSIKLRENMDWYWQHNSSDHSDYNSNRDPFASIVSDLLRKAKKHIEQTANRVKNNSDFKDNFHEVLFNFQLFLAKNLLYILLKKGNEKGFRDNDF